MKYKTFSNGNKIPAFGFGTDLVPEGETIINAVTWAIEKGYRLIDNADCYNNQAGVGIAIKNCIKKGIVKREDLFITSKVPDWKQGYEKTIETCKESLNQMGLDYFDLYLVHSPLRLRYDWQDTVIDTYRAIEHLYKEGLVKNIGVSNFHIRHLDFILDKAEIKPVINQIELHPQHQNKEVAQYCNKHHILVEAWGTLNQGRIFKNNLFIEMGKKYNVSPSQIAIKWSLDKNYIPLTRSTNKERISINFEAEKLKLSQDDIQILDGLDGGEFSNMHDDSVTKPTYSANLCWGGVNLQSEMFEYSPRTYTLKYKLFNKITILTEKKFRWNKRKLYLLGFLPFLKIIKQEKL